MNNNLKVENTDVRWNNWKNSDPIPFTKSNGSCVPQNYYLLSYNYLPHMLLNVNNSLQNSTFNCNSEVENTNNCDTAEFKNSEFKFNSNHDNNDVEKCNPNMLLQIELNADRSPGPVLSDNTPEVFREETVEFESEEITPNGKKFPDLMHCGINLRNVVKSTEESLKCNVCDKEFSDKNYLDDHMTIHFQRGKSRRCDYCDQTFSSKGKWYAHFKTHFSDPSFDCLACNCSFVTENYLQEHLKFHDKQEDEVNFTIRNEDRRFPCTFCEKKFADRSGIMFHLRIHTSEVIYRCTYCGKMFLNKSELNLHVRTHTGDKAHVCELCNKTFLTTSNLKQHHRIHTGDKPFNCSNCNKAFSNKSNLVQHMKVHTGEKPYHCKFCERSFTTTSNLTQHLRIHTGIKPYKCDFCGKTFINKSNLSQHEKVHCIGEKKKENKSVKSSGAGVAEQVKL